MSYYYVKITTKLRDDVIEMLDEAMSELNETYPDSPFAEGNSKKTKKLIKRLREGQPCGRVT